MSLSWKLGRVAGIEVYLHATLLLLLFLPHVVGSGIFSLAVMAAVYGCVVLHELGHALMARRFGIATHEITIYPIGGVARLSRMPRSPGGELLIALAGPAVNVAIASALAGLGALGVVSPEVLGFEGMSFARTVFWVNVGLAVFNMIPAFPMDGGRVLRALLSGWLGRLTATQIAAGLGRGLAILGGLWFLWNGMPMQAVLAAFIYLAANAELAQVLAEESARRFHQGAGGSGSGVWVAPPGHRWVSLGNGVWRLAPITVRVHDEAPPTWL